ncbi:MAG TPA: FIST N-terminal domain-containing protein [Minicystis sp.]|nr:FIST N-terminal domain-containing protein [Minicystis sp.]
MAEVQLKSARTQEADPDRAAEALCRDLGAAAPKLVTLFHGADRDAAALNRAVRARLPRSTRLVGATTAGEIDREGMHQGTVVLGALSGDFEVGLGLGAGLTDDAIGAGTRAIAGAAQALGVRQQDLDGKRYVGMVIDDGIRAKKEELLLGVLEKCPALTLVGGGANHHGFPFMPDVHGLIHVDGEVATDAVLVALFKTDAPWGALRSHWYEPTGQMVTITKVDETCTRALEIDGQPAAKRYAELIDVAPEELEFGTPKGFAARPTALKVGREYFIRAPFKPLEDGSIVFVNLLDEGAEFEIMRLVDPADATRRFFEEELPRRVKSPSACVLFHCTGRAWAAQNMGQAERLSEAFRAAPPSAGFNVCFELYSGFAINTTLTVLAFGKNDA